MAVTRALYVVGDEPVPPDAASRAAALLPGDVEWTVLVAIPEHPRHTTGATGFAGPVLTPEEMEQQAAADRVTGDGTAAAVAREIGDRPVEQLVRRGDPVDLVRLLAGSADVVVPAGADLAKRLASELEAPVLVVPATA